MKQTFKIPISPKPKQRPRFANGHAYTPRETANYEADIAYWVESHGGKKVTGPIWVDLGFYYKMPKRMKTPQPHTGRPDLDNLVKGVLDACQGVLWDNDSEIYCICADKKYAEDNGILINVVGGEP